MICVRSNDQHRSTNKPGLKHTHFVLWMKCLPTESATPPTTLWSLFTTFFSLFFLLRRSFSLSPRHSFALSYTLCLSGRLQCAVQTIYDWTGQTHFVALWFLSIALCLGIGKHFTQTSAMHSTRTHIGWLHHVRWSHVGPLVAAREISLCDHCATIALSTSLKRYNKFWVAF